jgi:hypothetical protein
MSDKRKFWWLWAIWGVIFLVVELVALFTKEKAIPTLSRTLRWLVNYQVKVRWKGNVIFTFKPWRIIFIVIVIWFPIHILGGECFAGIC